MALCADSVEGGRVVRTAEPSVPHPPFPRRSPVRGEPPLRQSTLHSRTPLLARPPVRRGAPLDRHRHVGDAAILHTTAETHPSLRLDATLDVVPPTRGVAPLLLA